VVVIERRWADQRQLESANADEHLAELRQTFVFIVRRDDVSIRLGDEFEDSSTFDPRRHIIESGDHANFSGTERYLGGTRDDPVPLLTRVRNAHNHVETGLARSSGYLCRLFLIGEIGAVFAPGVKRSVVRRSGLKFRAGNAHDRHGLIVEINDFAASVTQHDANGNRT